MPWTDLQDYVTAKQAADLLGVDVQTIYTYVRRKGLRSVEMPGERRRMYWRPDIERLTGEASNDLSSGDPGLGGNTAITAITRSGPYYRGLSAVDLSNWATLEHVAEVLWDAPGAFDTDPTPLLPEADGVWQATRHFPTCERAISLLSCLAAANTGAGDLSKPSFVRSSAQIVRLVVALLSGRGTPSAEPAHAVLARGFGAAPPFNDLIRRALVLAASHEFDPSSYAVRSAANTGITPFHAAIVGLATYRGRRLAVDRWAAVRLFIQEVLASARPADVVRGRLRETPGIPGFNSGVYKAGDPRAAALLDAMTRSIGDDTEFRALRSAIDAAYEIGGARPDFILASAFLNLKLGRSSEDVTFTVCARTVGWLAHAMEQHASSGMVRMRANYVGPLPRNSPAVPKAEQ